MLHIYNNEIYKFIQFVKYYSFLDIVVKVHFYHNFYFTILSFHSDLIILMEKGAFTMIYAYARVSAKDQNLDRQLSAFFEFGIDKRCVFCEKKSGKDFDRIQYNRLIKKLKNGDLLVIKSIDRLGRNYTGIIEEWNKITNIIGADILVLDMPLLDTRARADTLVGKFVSDIVLQVLSFVAQNERENIKARQAEGIKLAKEKGVRFGRPSFVYTDEFLSVAHEYLTKRIKLQTALQLLNIKQNNFYYHIRKIKNSILQSDT